MADRVPLDFDSPVRVLRALLLGVDDGELANPTPCPGWSVATLLDHLMGLSVAFTQGAHKRLDDPATSSAPEPSAHHLTRHWRSRLPVLLEDLANSWKDPAAWTGTSQAGGVTMPAAALGHVAMTELIMHSWDLARGTGQEYFVDPRTLEPLIEFLEQGPAEGTPGLFGPVVLVDDEATPLDRALALTGRDAKWSMPRRRRAAA